MILSLLGIFLVQRLAFRSGIQEFLWSQAEPLNGGVNSWPFFGKKFLAFALEQKLARTRVDEHTAASFALD